MPPSRSSRYVCAAICREAGAAADDRPAPADVRHNARAAGDHVPFVIFVGSPRAKKRQTIE
jgi:hypothetical protein